MSKTAAHCSWDAIRQALPGFEPRPQQEAMADAVAYAVSAHRHLIVEAGTGTGKSFAYLVPALEAIRDHDKTVVVSTRTIALQEQLVRKDVPFLLKALGMEDLPIALAKGRSNFVCRRKAAAALQRATKLVADQDRHQLENVVAWAAESKDGTRSSIKFRLDGHVWEKVAAEKGNCLGKKCKFFGTCAFQESRRAMKNARLVVANHSLVCADMALQMETEGRASILPAYDVLVLDEAHEFGEVATEAFRSKITEGSVRHLLGQLHVTGNPDCLFARAGAPANLALLVSDARTQAELYFAGAEAFRPAFVPDRRIYKPHSFKDPLSPVLRKIRLGMEGRRFPDKPDVGLEWIARRDKLGEMIDVLDQFAKLPDIEDRVYWQDWTPKSKRPLLAHALLDVAPLLRDRLFDRVGTVVLTSATLQVASGFDHLRRELGVQGGDEIDVGSPFDFARQCTLLTYPDWPPPRHEDFEALAISEMRRLVLAAGGGAFLLFASYRALDEAFDALWSEFSDADLRVLKHGVSQFGDVVEAFRAHDNCVLFGTATYWQGVDVPGNNLRLVVIHKLPFAVPSHPLRKAREEAIEKRGGNPFVQLSVPEAVIRIKQGFGRLIRTSTDEGTVAILDSRLHTKGYGRTFLRSLPECRCPRTI